MFFLEALTSTYGDPFMMFLGIHYRRHPGCQECFRVLPRLALLGGVLLKAHLSGSVSYPSHSFSQCHLLGGKSVTRSIHLLVSVFNLLTCSSQEDIT